MHYSSLMPNGAGIFQLLLLPYLSSVAYALNDWTKPCLQGQCSYDLPPSAGASGTMRIWGSADAITDITPAAGWTILNCDKNALAQNIRLVCNSDDTTAVGCDHLHQSFGAVGKIVRLPENCGKSPFARIARSWVDQDQSVPSHIARRLIRRDNATAPQVQGLALDTNFASVDPSQGGNVNIAIQGSTIPGDTGNATVTPSSPQRRSRLARRGIVSFIENAFDNFNSFDQSTTQQLPPVDVDKTFPIFESQISCPATGNIPAVDASLKADVVTKAHAVITVGAAASGTIVPPVLSDFGIFVGMDAELDGTLELAGSAAGSIDSGKISLFEVGIPGLDFPGILSVGPTFKIQAQAKASLDIDVNMNVDLSYSVNGAKLFFPASSNHQSGGGFTPGNNPLKMSVSPSIASKGTVEAHLIPGIDLGISALGGAAKATVSLDLDASASATLSLNAAASASLTQRDTSTDDSNSDDGALDDSSLDDSSSGDSSPDDTSFDDGTSSASSDDSSTSDDQAPADDPSLDSSSSADDSTSDDSSLDNSGADSSSSDDSSLDSSSSDDSTLDDPGSDSPTSDDSTLNDPSSDATTSDDSSLDSTSSDDLSSDGTDATNVGDDSSLDTSSSDNGAGLDASNADSDPSLDGSNANNSTLDASTPDSSSPSNASNSDDSTLDDQNAISASPNATSPDATNPSSDVPNTGASKSAAASTSSSASVNGCATVNGNMDVSAGADGSFFNLFDKSTKVSLFSKEFEIFKKCFGTNTRRRRESRSARHARAIQSRALSCLSADPAKLVSLAG